MVISGSRIYSTNHHRLYFDTSGDLLNSSRYHQSSSLKCAASESGGAQRNRRGSISSMAASDVVAAPATEGYCYIRLPSEPDIAELPPRIFDELPTTKVVSVSRPDAGDFTPLLLSYTIEFQYKQVLTPEISFLLF